MMDLPYQVPTSEKMSTCSLVITSKFHIPSLHTVVIMLSFNYLVLVFSFPVICIHWVLPNTPIYYSHVNSINLKTMTMRV